MNSAHMFICFNNLWSLFELCYRIVTNWTTFELKLTYQLKRHIDLSLTLCSTNIKFLQRRTHAHLSVTYESQDKYKTAYKQILHTEINQEIVNTIALTNSEQ
jgi:hypothetical protein